MNVCHKILRVAACQVYIYAICTAISENHISAIMQAEYLSLCTKKSKYDASLTKLWTKVNDIASKVSFHHRKKSELEHRLDCADESLGGPAISCIAGGSHNEWLRRYVCFMALERSKIQMEIKTQQLIMDNFTNRYNAVFEKHSKLCCKVNSIRKKIRSVENRMTNDSAMTWSDIHEAESF